MKLSVPSLAAECLCVGADLKPAKLSASADLLGQFITNLLTNAIRYNGNNGEVRIATDVSTWKPNW